MVYILKYIIIFLNGGNIKMKIETKILAGFLKKTQMDKSQLVDECILDFQKEGLKINANAKAQLSRVMAWLKTSAFEEYEEIGKIGVNDLSNIIKVMERFGEKITLSKEGNLLTIKGKGKKVDVELVAENFLATDTGEPKLEFEETFTLTATKLKSIFADVLLNKDAIITIETEPKKIKFSNTGKYKFVNELEAETCKGGTKVNLGEPFIDATNSLDGNLNISIKTDYPVKIMETTETSIITVIVAPRVETE